MIAGVDSAYPPSSAALTAAKNAGVRLWAGYFAGPNILNGWTQADFDRVKAAGLATLAFCSGWSDPAAIKAQSSNWQVATCLDVEGGIRGMGSWVQPWLDISGAGLYGNPPIHAGMRAAFHICAAYPGANPMATWPSYIGHPATPCGWQWEGTHSAFGVSVDSAWYDDEFAAAFGPVPGELEMLDPNDPIVKQIYADLGLLIQQVGALYKDGTSSTYVNEDARTQAVLDAIKALGGAAGLTEQQVQDACVAALKSVSLRVA